MSKRRTRGDGGLVQRHDHPTCPPADENGERPEHKCRGRWQGTLDTFEGGKRRRKYVYGRTQAQAKAKLDEAREQKRAGTLVVSSMTVAKWLDQWLEKKRQPPKPLKPQTWRSYESKVRLYLKPHVGRHRLTALEPLHIEAMYDTMRGEGLAEATLRQTHAILGKALTDAIRKGILGVSPMARVDPPGTETNQRTPLTVAQAQVVLRYTDDARWWLALFYGMRQGECLGLRWADIDWGQRTLTIAQTLQTDEQYRIVFGTPKSKAGKRTIPLLPQVEARLRLHHLNSGSPTDGLVFHNAGKPIWPNKDNAAWHQLLADATRPPWAPIPDVPLHAARNTAASVMEAAGIPDRLVAQILGQSQVTTTHGYQHAELERMRQALAGMGAVLELD